MLTNYDLEELCEEFDVPLHGIYMKDQLPKRIKNGNYIIIVRAITIHGKEIELDGPITLVK